MNGANIVVDTNVLINLLEGRHHVEPYLENNNIFISIITEIELLGWHRISEKDKKVIRNLLNDISIVDLSQQIKEIAISIKQKHNTKLPDAIIAATSVNLNLPLITFDKSLSKIERLNLILAK